MASLPSTLAFVDTETTGLNPGRHRIVEIGVIRVENGKVVDTLDSLVQPHSHLPPEITSITGITRESLARAPDFEELKHQVGLILADAIFVAHNARFDYAFLKHEFSRHGDELRARVLCTVRLTRRLFPKIASFSLESIINYFGIKVSARHRAFADADVLWKLYQISLQTHGEEKVSDVISSILKTPSLPSNLNSDIVEKLPETPGVYIFSGEDTKLPLYVGKSVNIKDRVKGHFSSDYHSTTDLAMSSQIARIDVITTAGEIGALIREADAIKALMPVYNRQLRRRRDLIVAIAGKVGDYDAVSVKNFQETKVDVGQIMAVYKSKKNAKDSLHALSREYHLCPKLLGIENGRGRCFASQIGVCYGACALGEDAGEYNQRFNEAFKKTRVRKWPFKTAVAIKEENLNGLVELHLVNKWIYLGSIVYSGASDDEPKVEKYTPRFDWDIYKILTKAMLVSKNIQPVTQEIEATLVQGQAGKGLL